MTADPQAEKVKHRAIKWAEGVAALSVLIGMRSCAAALEAIPKTDDYILRHVLFSGLVVSYARAFEVVKHPHLEVSTRFRVRKMEGEGFNKAFHDALLAMRNAQIAHAGHSLNDYDLTFLRDNLKVATKQPDGSVKETNKRHIIGTRARASLAAGLVSEAVSAELLAHVRALEQEAVGRLCIAIVEHDAASVFRLEQEAADGKSYGNVLATKTFKVPPGLVVLDEDDLVLSLAKMPAGLRLAFAVLTFNLVQDSEGFSLNCSIHEVLDPL